MSKKVSLGHADMMFRMELRGVSKTELMQLPEIVS